MKRRPRALPALAAGSAIALSGCGGAPPAPPADLVLTGGRIVTMDPARPEATALAARGGRLVAVGSEAEVERLVGPATRVVALEGQLAVPGLIENLGGGDPLALSLSINVGASLVDVSPLSTLGALCVAAVPDGPPAKQLFRQLLIWGVSMAVVGGLICQLLALPLARA